MLTNYTKFLLSNYFQTKAMLANKSISSTDACNMADSIVGKADQGLMLFYSGTSIYNDVNIIYNYLFAGNYYKGMQALIASNLVMKATPQKEAASKAKLLYQVIQYNNSAGVDKYYFQLQVVIPYFYNVMGDKNYTTSKAYDRYSTKGKKIKGCGYLICN